MDRLNGSPGENAARPRRGRYEEEIALLRTRYGTPLDEWITIDRRNTTTGPAGFPLSSRRTAEVVFVVPRTRSRVLFHTKRFYPAGVWRLPTGGLHRLETIEAAVRREILEETSLPLEPVRFLFHLRFRWAGLRKEFQSFGFLMTPAHGAIRSQDRREQIAGFRDLSRSQVGRMAHRLASLEGSWASWGRFRAAPHRAVLRLWPEDGGWFPDPEEGAGPTPPSSGPPSR
ncbi:MAG: NUDIX domain-containing protein [Candidatus Eisenbacteria bacterium]|nr:NUDIX domain-containing protein [Candidatus Latescibacterota bacterium]MBD3302679.1 NUDIX domain-containing protein [Candidatus Eisenbacteria bacterium]